MAIDQVAAQALDTSAGANDGEKLDATAFWHLRDRYIKRVYADAVK